MTWANLRDEVEAEFADRAVWSAAHRLHGFHFGTTSAERMRRHRAANKREDGLERAAKGRPYKVDARKVAALAAAGMSTARIAVLLGVSEGTVSKARKRAGAGLANGSNQFRARPCR